MVLTLVGSSSPISADESSPETAPEGASLHEKADVTQTDQERIRDLIDAGSFEEALGEVRSLLAGDPTPEAAAGARLLEARLLERLDQGWEAVRVYRRAIDDPTVGEQAKAELHDLHVRRGEFSAADRLTEGVGEGGPGSDPAQVRRRAYSKTVQGDYDVAARLLSDLAVAGDGHAGVLRANALLALGDRDGAEGLYLQVLEHESQAPVRQAAHFGLGQVARLRGARAVRAIQDEKTVALGAAPWAQLDWALALRALGRRGEARTHLQEAAATNPGLTATTGLVLARLQEEEGHTDQALESLSQSLEGGVADFLAWTRLGDLLLQESEEDAGIQAYRAALELFPGFPPAVDRLSRALAARGRWEETPAPVEGSGEWDLPGWTWERLLDGDLPFYETVADRATIPLTDPRRFVLALVQLRSGFPAGALGWAEPGGGPLLETVRAQALEAAGRPEDAAEVWEAILATGLESPIARERLALLSYDRDPERAAQHWSALFAGRPGRARARLRQAHRMEEAQDWQGALEAYQAAATGDWLSANERRSIRRSVADLESELQDADEARTDAG